MNTIDINEIDPTAETVTASTATRTRSTLRTVAAALVVALLGTVGVAAAAPGSASAASGPSSGQAPFVADAGCNYRPALASGSEGFYTQFWSYDANRGGWSAGSWYYTQGAANWEYMAWGWSNTSAVFQPPPSSTTVYVWARTYSASKGWQSYIMGRCYNGRSYAGW